MHIHIISPSGAIEPQYIDNAYSVLRQQGYRVSMSPHAKGRYGRFSGTEEERLADLNAALDNPDIDIILCSRGGYGMAQIVDSIQLPKTHRPMVIGFSDITCLHNLLGQKDIPSLHAIMTKHIATLPKDAPALQSLWQCLRGEDIDYRLPSHPLNKTGVTQGILRGGNLSVLYGLQGTPYAINTKRDTILFIEDICERHYHVDRMLQNLRLSGVLSKLKGLIVGQFTDCDDDPSMRESLQESIMKAVSEYDYPVVFDFPAGHVEYNLPLLMNQSCQLSITPDEVHFRQEAVLYQSTNNKHIV
ncbi:MAG: LD-carboxypeptidase [Paludibacter sp.]|nr:LD-carboxypeptidase [Bacteroidales bacterium]MCM1068464.1 LD-carboxypeptidase [Prevotella sp.]MCM1353418.1 LD-carboxypeptidase [Bacteroides sp.]MCM1442579.1 LD-carboxypeptidase [Muribaculum sp.]MCM1481424.1 LD-carboxypeptidase [Paludibacter sp.]